MTTITTVLFDADGVVQLTEANWYEAWSMLIDDGDDADSFIEDIFEVERPFLTGGDGFESSVLEVLSKWKSNKCFDDVLNVWTMIDPSEEMLQLARDISSNGTRVGLATNQQSHRYEHMMSALGYESIFDDHFVSFKMGVRKPSVEYFQQILETVSCAANEILFFDDNEPNVRAARTVGINAELYHLREGKEKIVELLRSYEIPGI